MKLSRFSLSLVVCFISLQNLEAQTSVYGLAGSGAENAGSIFKYDITNKKLISVFEFPKDHKNPVKFSKLVEAKNGKLYGLTSNGGKHGYGSIISFDPITNTEIAHYDFSLPDTYQNGSMVSAKDGLLYGTTQEGGSNQRGTIFSFDVSSNTYTKVWDFKGQYDGMKPIGTLIESNDGKLYGLTQNGGSGDLGILYSFDPATKTKSNIFDFPRSLGGYSNGSIIEGEDGVFYGMTLGGGIYNKGTIYSFHTKLNQFIKLHDFNETNGSFPYGGLLKATDHKFYGLTSSGGANNTGIIFSFDASINLLSKLYDFKLSKLVDSNEYGIMPSGNLIQAQDGKLYGLTGGNGAYFVYASTIFSFDPKTNNYKLLSDFVDLGNAYSTGSLIQANNGILYGMTENGGTMNVGTIFSFDPLNKTLSKLHEFKNNFLGQDPSGKLIKAGNGKLYGMTTQGGMSNLGTIFSFDPVTQVHTKEYDFKSVDGANPYGSLIQVNNGKLYGMTYNGELFNSAGNIFSFDLNANIFKKEFNFTYVNGGNPWGSLIQATNGKLYGMNRNGGAQNGTVFSFDPVKNIHTKLYDLNSLSGFAPYGSLIQARNGKIYGSTRSGGKIRQFPFEGPGTLFTVDPISNTFSKLWDFDYTNGSYPSGNLLEASNGKLYGLTSTGGNLGAGVLYSYDPSTNKFAKIFDFAPDGNWVLGSRPFGTLAELKKNILYGRTGEGGDFGNGVIFSFNIETSKYVKEIDLDKTYGHNESDEISFNLFDNNLMPNIKITSPLENSVFELGQSVILTSDAFDSDGDIKKVEFYENGVRFLIDSIAPYSYTTNEIEPRSYLLTAIAIDDKDASTLSMPVNVTVNSCQGTGSIFAEGFTNIPGSAVFSLTSNPNYPNNPNINASLNSFEYDSAGNDYGGRVRGYICPPLSGYFVFFISGDDQAALWLSTDEDPENKVLIAYNIYWTDFRQFTKFPTQKSAPIKLEIGKRYYIESLHKQAVGKDHLTVAWQLPTGVLQSPISTKHLMPLKTLNANNKANFSTSMIKSFQVYDIKNEKLVIQVLPNPSTTYFKVTIKSGSKENINLSVSDITGRVIESNSKINANSTYEIGRDWKQGMYLLQAIQGGEHKTIKLLKD